MVWMHLQTKRLLSAREIKNVLFLFPSFQQETKLKTIPNFSLSHIRLLQSFGYSTKTNIYTEKLFIKIMLQRISCCKLLFIISVRSKIRMTSFGQFTIYNIKMVFRYRFRMHQKFYLGTLISFSNLLKFVLVIS